MRGWNGGEPPLDPPDDPPLVECPDCEGEGVREDPSQGDIAVTCARCDGDGEAYLTDDEVRDQAAEAQIERAEARRDGYL